MLQIEDALEIILNRIVKLPEEEVDLADALGRALRRDAFSDLDLPPFDRARMDGYALRVADTEGRDFGNPGLSA
ncbi:MAG: hypothetical protein IPJ07_20185 [Acidobacteria bacterium]|nr:hypothetical protein [Acidobacteriota bacterium]